MGREGDLPGEQGRVSNTSWVETGQERLRASWLPRKPQLCLPLSKKGVPRACLWIALQTRCVNTHKGPGSPCRPVSTRECGRARLGLWPLLTQVQRLLPRKASGHIHPTGAGRGRGGWGVGDKGAGEGRPAGRALGPERLPAPHSVPRTPGQRGLQRTRAPPRPPPHLAFAERLLEPPTHSLPPPPGARGARGARGSQPRPTPQGSLQARRVPWSATAFDSVVPPLPAPSHQPPGPWTRGLGVHQTPCPGLSLRLTLGSSQQPLPQLLPQGRPGL